MTVYMREQLNRDEGYAEGYAEGYVEGYAEGDHNACVRIAKKMLAIGMDHKLTAKYSSLPLEEIEALAQPQPA